MLRPLLLAAAAAAACAAPPAIAPEVVAEAPGTSIVACGRRIDIGAPVVLWSDDEGYSAYDPDYRFGTPPVVGPNTPRFGDLRYKPGRTARDTGLVEVEPEIGTFEQLERALDLFVLHYDVCLTSQSCFKVLHDRRGLSVHFMLDVDGTLYQTMDLRDTAWHARQANPRSVGVEIANIGAYPLNDEGDAKLARYYEKDADGARIDFPRPTAELGVRTPGYVARPARRGVQMGRIHGTPYQQYDFTAEQYATLVKLTSALCRTFPNLRPDCPRDANGAVLLTNMDPETEAAFHGIVGHFHVGGHKQDPGPAFDWELFLTRVRTRLGRL
ncbi:MAG: N-acetylmuramoyl-L-alanine amidase [Planctomycetota bacterium]